MVLSLTELGKRLVEARKQKNLTLDELQAMTKIQKRYLQAIEDGNLDILPGKFYARAFIKQYAEAVGLDPERLFDEYASEIPKTETEPTEVPNSLSRRQRKKSTVSSQTSNLLASILPKLLIALLVICVVVFLWLFFQDKQGSENAENVKTEEPPVESQQDENITIINPSEENIPEETDEEEAEETMDNEEEQSQNETVPEEPIQQLVQIEQKNGSSPLTVYELTGAEEFLVEITAAPNGRSYVGIENGLGKSFYAGEVKNGEKLSYDFTAEQEIMLNVGRTLDVSIKINGQDFAYPFTPNEKVHQKIKIKFIKESQQ